MRSAGPTKFHSHHGSNIVLDSSCTLALRETSFANALAFSEQPLQPGEIFLIEIVENEIGWSGHMRIGLTQMSPDSGFPLPLYALPDLVSLGPSWLYAITKKHNNVYEAQNQVLQAEELVEDLDNMNVGSDDQEEENEDEEEEADDEDEESSPETQKNPQQQRQYPQLRRQQPGPVVRNVKLLPRRHVEGSPDNNSFKRNNGVVLTQEGDFFKTPRGYIRKSILMPHAGKSDDLSYLLPTDVGSRIGVLYVPREQNKADMHFIINGEDQGICAKDIPYRNAPLHAVVDVYGSTKQVRIVQLNSNDSLQSLCRDTIRQRIKISGNLTRLPLPKTLINYLMYL